jgi:hypothetical protein
VDDAGRAVNQAEEMRRGSVAEEAVRARVEQGRAESPALGQDGVPEDVDAGMQPDQQATVDPAVKRARGEACAKELSALDRSVLALGKLTEPPEKRALLVRTAI